MKKNQITYQQAIEELDKIIEDFEQDKIEFDQVQSTIIRAKKLFEYCQSLIKQSKEQINDMFKNKQ